MLGSRGPALFFEDLRVQASPAAFIDARARRLGLDSLVALRATWRRGPRPAEEAEVPDAQGWLSEAFAALDSAAEDGTTTA